MENDQERRITREQLERYRTAVIAAVRSVDVPDLGQTRMAAIGDAIAGFEAMLQIGRAHV